MSYGGDSRETRKVVSGEVEVRHEGVNILGNGTRVGHDDRRGAMRHIMDVHQRGYITGDEAEARMKAAQNAEKRGDLTSLTSDLPAPFAKAAWRYDWGKTSHWLPTLLGSMGFSAVLAVVPTAVLSQEHLFPHNAAALGLGIVCILLGIIGFFASIGGIIAKVD
jgi:hypothetical protein